MNLPIVTSVFSLSFKQEEDLPFIDHPESETSEQIYPPVTRSLDIKPEILIRFKEEEFRTEPQGLEERGNIPSIGICEELHETDDGFRNNSKRKRMCDGQQREEWKHKDPFRNSPDYSHDCEGGICSVTPTRVKKIAQKGERSSAKEKNSNYSPRHVQTGGFKEEERYCKSADTRENFTTGINVVEHDISRPNTEVHHRQGIQNNSPSGDTTNQNKPFECFECGKCFSKKDHLQRHKMTHTGHKPYKCSECDKCFIQKAHLELHKMNHRGEKPFKCSECDKCFGQKSDLQRHKMTHTGYKPFKCSDCDKYFGQKSDLQRHKMIHTGHKPFKCSECDKGFSRKANLQLHKMKKKHNKTIQQKNW